MPYKKTRSKKLNASISENLYRYLLTGERIKGDAECFFLAGSRERLKKVWDAVKDEILNDWIKKNPGRRPWAWYEFDGPRRDTGTGAFFEPLPVPRQRIGGQGEMTWEKYPAVVPLYEKGIPDSWAWIDEEDPPRFESEAVYLDRHDLLSESEKRFLTKHPELLEPEKVVEDNE